MGEDCGCNKNRTRPTGMEAAAKRRQEVADRAKAEAAARADNHSTRRIGPPVTGASQTFSLQLPDGSSRSFGSVLERDAWAARHSS